MITKGQVIVGGVAVALGTGAAVGGVLGTRKISDEDLTFMPPLSVLTWETDFPTGYSEGTIGKKFGWYLVGTYGVSDDGTKQDNRDWWNWSYKRWKIDLRDNKDSLSSEFNEEDNVKSGFSGSSDSEQEANKAMNKVCQKIYKRQTTDIEFEKKTDSDNKFKLSRDLLKYCSPLLRKPLTIEEKEEEGSYSTDSFGRTYKNTLISTREHQTNFVFWKLRNQEFFGKSDENGTGHGLESTKDSPFYELYSKKSNQQRSDDLVDTCSSIYTSNQNGENAQKKKDNLLKFCSWDYKVGDSA